jgi:hypothetical protein
MMRFSMLFVFAVIFGFTVAVSGPAAAQQPKGKKAPPQEPQVMDISDNIRATIDAATGKYYKISGPFGRSYFVVGDDMGFKEASVTVEKFGNVPHNITRIVIDVKEDERGIQLIGMAGVQIEQLTKDAKVPEITVVRTGNQTVEIKEKCQLTVVIGKPVPPMPKVQPKAPPKK